MAIGWSTQLAKWFGVEPWHKANIDSKQTYKKNTAIFIAVVCFTIGTSWEVLRIIHLLLVGM